MNKIVLSIIIPTHNSQNTIKPLLLSINNSSSVNFNILEVIIVDDKSKDNTLKIIKDLYERCKFKTKVLVLKKNVGPAKARNLGAKKAQGKYLLFLDGDVELKNKTLINVFKIIDNKKTRAFTGIWDYHQKTTNFFPQFKALRDWSYWFAEREEYSHYYLFSTRIAGIEKKLFQKLNGFIEDYQEPTVEDIEFTYRIEKQSSIKFCANIMVNHEFEDFLPIAIKYFKRSRDWIKLYLKRFRFDPVATSKREAFKSILSSVIIFLLLMSIFFKLLIIPAVILFLIFSYLELKFWSLILHKKGFIFLLKSIPTSMILYLFINLGAAWGYMLAFKNHKQPIDLVD
jgi:glycosyltransferase involved in cell wall biosynthesis